MTIQRDGDRLVLVLQVRYLKAVLVGLVAVAVGAAGFVVVSALGIGRADPAAVVDSTWIASPRVSVAVDGRPFRGAVDAPVTIVEFTDYQCPFCRRFARETLPSLLERYGDQLRYVVRNYPIPSLHPNALPAAAAAECAHRLRKFWEFHDALFYTDAELTRERLRSLAGEVGLDIDAFDRCVDARATRDLVARDVLDASELGVGSTPTFFVNGRRVRGARSLEDMQKYIELALVNQGR